MALKLTPTEEGSIYVTCVAWKLEPERSDASSDRACKASARMKALNVRPLATPFGQGLK